MARIVTTSYRPKRPPRKRQAVALKAPAVVRAKKPGPRSDLPTPATPESPSPETRPVIVQKRRLPDPTPEEQQELPRRAEAADALWADMVRRMGEKGGR